MIAGQLRHKVRLETPAYTDDGQGGRTRAATPWTSLGYSWAAVEPLTSKDQFFAQHLQNRVSHRVTIRYRDDVTAECRVVFRSRTLTIRSLRNIDERDKEIELLCEENVT
jgi:SPP1 family predicted phage head-tail adaptor